jgi:hypothetical protein
VELGLSVAVTVGVTCNVGVIVSCIGSGVGEMELAVIVDSGVADGETMEGEHADATNRNGHSKTVR